MKIICVDCHKQYSLPLEKLKNFECNSCGCDDYKELDYHQKKPEKTILRKKENPGIIKNPLIEENKEEKETIMKKIDPIEVEEDLEEEEEETENMEEEEDDDTEEELFDPNRYNLVDELIPYIKRYNLKNITLEYDYQGVNVTISLKNE